MTVASQVDKLRLRFGLKKVILVGDRGMLTSARIHEDLNPHARVCNGSRPSSRSRFRN